MSLHLISKVQRLKKLKADRRAAQAKFNADYRNKTLSQLLPHTPEWAKSYFEHCRFKAVYGGRASGKSHFLAELMLARMVQDPDLQCVVIRKYRKSLTNSVQLLLKNKVIALGWSHLFDTQSNTIKRIGARGFVAFQGMQDHNAESIKSFENFGIAWVEEATELDQYSIDLLVPTIRSPGSEEWFSWNPDQPTDPVDAMFRKDPPENAIVTQVSFKDNPFLTEESKQDEQDSLKRDPEKHDWIWLGGYNVKSDAIIFSGRWRVAALTKSADWDGPYYGADWGFSTDPTAAIEVWVIGQTLYISNESHEYRLETDKVAKQWMKDIPGIEKYVVKADNARPESISLVRRKGISRITACEKWTGCVEDGIEFIKNYDIVIHPDCKDMILEAKRYRYKQNKAGEVLTDIVDKDNHLWDSLRYALGPLIRQEATVVDQLAAMYG